MHSSKEQQSGYTPDDSLFGMAFGQLFMASVLGPVADMVWEAGEAASAVYTDRFEAKAAKADVRTNGIKGDFTLGVKNSLGSCFTRARTPPRTNGNDISILRPAPAHALAV